MSDPHELKRRGFVKIVLTFLGTVMGAVIGIPAIGYIISPITQVKKKEDWISLGPLENYTIGQPKLFSFTQTTVNGWERTVNSYGVYVIRQNETESTVYSNMCTHLSCRVTWKEDLEEYVCPCHDGHFGSDGAVLAGPPPAPLKSYETKVEDGVLSFFFNGA
jgi:Rieske Fe-S protein